MKRKTNGLKNPESRAAMVDSGEQPEKPFWPFPGVRSIELFQFSPPFEADYSIPPLCASFRRISQVEV
jgi:hypothetical protein